MTDRERFGACQSYAPADRRPNHELGVWGQTRQRWEEEAPEAVAGFGWHWFAGEDELGFDRREYIPVQYGFLPPFEPEVREETDEYVIARNRKGILTKALKDGAAHGTRACMDQYLAFPVQSREDFRRLRDRLDPHDPARQPTDLEERAARWRRRDCPLCLGANCAANGFYWRAREFMGTEALSFAWYDEPVLMHEMMEWFADFIIEASRPALATVTPEYFVLNEDMSMKSGPLLSPETYRTFILPHLKRLTAFLRGQGVRWIAVDSDGDPTALIPLLLEGGVDTLWPIERASGVSPVTWRREFGRDLRLWGGVDKRLLPRGEAAVKEHLRELLPLIEEGGYIPTVDHTVPPDVSWDDFRRYLDLKRALLAGDAAALS